ncbi:MAG: hypothetical protein M3P04_04480, partial [Actinomycetota bacterium]|nr:hypothetical protein [Actinomycetota bacterium]
MRAPRLLLAAVAACLLSGTPVAAVQAQPPLALGVRVLDAPSDFAVGSLIAGRDNAGTPYLLAQVHNTG